MPLLPGAPASRNALSDVRAIAIQRTTCVFDILPGLTMAAFGAALATYLSAVTGGPASLFAMMAGLALRAAAKDPNCRPGLTFSSGRLLQWSIVLLGAQISLHDVIAYGPGPLIIVGVSLVGGLAVALGLAKLLKLEPGFAWVAGLGVAICGASAALAAASLLPRTAQRDTHALFVALAVTVLSTAAMVVYPLLAVVLGFDATETGMLLGATIHDLAQVIGAGYGVSTTAGDAAVVTKLIRVALLAPALLAMAWAIGVRSENRIGVPPFLLAFLLLSLLTSTGIVPSAIGTVFAQISSVGFLMAICVIAMRLRWSDFIQAEPRQLGVLCTHTTVLFLIAATVIICL